MVRNGSSSRTQLLPKSQDDSGVAWKNVPAFISAEDWPSGNPDLNSLDYKLWAVLEDMVCQKRHINLDTLKRSFEKAAAEILLETVRVAIAKWSERLASRQREAILSGIIRNKNLKLLLINYFGLKVDVLFHFPSRSQYTWDRTYGRIV